MQEISVAAISYPVQNALNTFTYSFVCDEIYRLAEKGITVYATSSKFKENFSQGQHFHGLVNNFSIRALGKITSNIAFYPKIACLRRPSTIFMEQIHSFNTCEAIKRYGIDLIHAHFAYPEGLVGLLVKRRTKKPLVITLHGYDILTDPSIGYGVRLSKTADSLVRTILNEADAVVAASTATFREAHKIAPNPKKLKLIPNGVDIQRFHPELNCSNTRRKLGLDDKATIVFTLRSHEPKYGLEYLIRAAKIVTKHRSNVVFVIGGDGSLRHYYEWLANTLGLRGKIVFTGTIPQDEVTNYYAVSDIVVVPSIQEAFGLVVAEAMATGKPVIGTNVGGIPDQIIDGYNGFLVSPKRASEIAEKIVWLIDNTEEAKYMGIRGRKIVEEKFNLDQRTQKMIKLYESLVQ